VRQEANHRIGQLLDLLRFDACLMNMLEMNQCPTPSLASDRARRMRNTSTILFRASIASSS
jgi:hypothetical protein